MDWAAIAKAAREGFQKGVNEWILASRVKGGRIQGPNAELTPGSLGSHVDFEPTIVHALNAAFAPPPVARALAKELYGAWKEWSDGFQMSLPGAYPKFAAVPGPHAPLTPAAQPAYSLSQATSAGEYRFQAATCLARMRAALLPYLGRDAAEFEKAFFGLASWIEGSFREWKANARLVGVQGKGPVPTFAPPYVPVAPVVMGDNTSLPGNAAAIAGPRFGKFVH
jgi:hypothetical protein